MVCVVLFLVFFCGILLSSYGMHIYILYILLGGICAAVS